jgi:hypothetical protein
VFHFSSLLCVGVVLVCAVSLLRFEHVKGHEDASLGAIAQLLSCCSAQALDCKVKVIDPKRAHGVWMNTTVVSIDESLRSPDVGLGLVRILCVGYGLRQIF